jgi:hypothetical protein
VAPRVMDVSISSFMRDSRLLPSTGNSPILSVNFTGKPKADFVLSKLSSLGILIMLPPLLKQVVTRFLNCYMKWYYEGLTG